MDFRNRGQSSQPVPPSQPAAQAPPAKQISAAVSGNGIGKKLLWVALVVFLVLLVLTVAAKAVGFSGRVPALSLAGNVLGLKTADSAVNSNRYQAVFLTNNQVYFGHLSQITDEYIKLTDIYYLQVQQQVQPAEGDQQPQVSLAKLGSELHGPEDVMYISRDQVLFWENLKEDGKVAQAIKEHKNN